MRTRLLTAALVLGTGGLGFVPLAVAAEPVTVAPTAEAWFQAPSCTSPLGCVAPPPVPGAPTAVSFYPSGTLHAAVSGGQETARTYLAVPAVTFADATGAVLRVPVDTDPASGTFSPETAKLQVCLTRTPVVPVEGSLAEPPTADCTSAAPVSYAATPEPRLEADLAPLLEGLSTASGLVLLPDGTSLAPGDAWHVAFSSVRRTPATPAPASVSVVRQDAPTPPQEAPAAPGAPDAPAPLDVSEAPALQAPEEPAPEPELGGEPAVAVEQVALGEAPLAAGTDTVPVAQVGPETVLVGYAYPAVWLLPLGLLVVVPLVARTLTRDLTPPAVQEQPVA